MDYQGTPQATTTKKGAIQLTGAWGGSSDAPVYKSTVAFSVYRTTDSASLTASVFTKILWDAERYDIGGAYDLTTNNRFDAPYDGLYLFTLQCQFAAADMRAFCSIYKNGAEVKRGYDVDIAAYRASVCTTLLPLVAGDYIEAYAWRDTAGLLDGTVPGNFLHFEGALIGRT